MTFPWKLARPVLLAACLPLAGAAQDWTDRAEYDMALAVRTQSAPMARLALLDQWKQKYPQSPVRQLRGELTLSAAQAVGDAARTLTAARELVALDANHFPGNYWIALLTPGLASSNEQTLADAEKSAGKLVSAADVYFSTGLGKAAGPKQKTETLALAHRVLGWVAWRRGNLDVAGRELAASLEITPSHAEASAWLGSALVVQKERGKQAEGIWHLARAGFLDGDGALTAPLRRDVRALLEAAYVSYHGSAEGLEETGKAAAAESTATKAPASFKLETAAEVTQRKIDEEMAANNPQLFTWVQIRRRLTGPDGQAEFNKLAEGTLPLLKGYVVRCDVDPKPTEAFVGLIDFATEEINLKFDAALPRCAESGVAIEFQGKPMAFTAEPFRLSVAVAGAELQGWPVPDKK